MLSEAQRAAYARDGFLFVPELLGAEQRRALAAWADELSRQPDRRDYVRKYGDDGARARGQAVLSRIEYTRAHHAGLAQLFASELLRTPAGELLGADAVLFKDKLNYKPPGSDGFALHQDVQAGWHTYARDFLTVLIAIDDMTVENGCLEVIAGAHRSGMLGAQWQPLTAADVAGRTTTALPARAGDAIFFGGLLPHGSAPNRSSAPRRALLVTYNPLAQGDHYERYFADKRRSFPPDIEREPGREYRYLV